jgi:hypothetical protein
MFADDVLGRNRSVDALFDSVVNMLTGGERRH